MESEEIEYTIIGKKGDIYISDVTKGGNEIIAINGHDNQLLFYDIDHSTLKFKTLEDVEKKIVGIAGIKDNLYLFDINSRSLIKVDKKSLQEKDVYRIPYRAIKLTTISSEFIMIDSTYDNEKKIIDNKKRVIFESYEKNEGKKSGMYAIYHSGIEGMNNAEEKVSFYFTRDKYVMYRFNEGEIEWEADMSLSVGEMNKLKDLFSGMMQLKIDENNLFKLRDWIKTIENKQNIYLEERVSCGERILSQVKRMERGND